MKVPVFVYDLFEQENIHILPFSIDFVHEMDGSSYVTRADFYRVSGIAVGSQVQQIGF